MPLCEGRLIMWGTTSRSEVFQFTPLREGRQAQVVSVEIDVLFQFTPLCEGRHQYGYLYCRYVAISIHAPV